MFSRHARLAMAGGALGAIVISSAALAAAGQTYSQKFTVKAPGKATGINFAAASKAVGGKAPVQAKTVTITMPAGTKINSGALPACTAAPACPATTQVGTGQATVMLGAITKMLPVTAYNRTGGMFLVVTNPLGAPVVLQPVLAGGKLTIQLPSLTIAGLPLVVAQLTLKVNKLGTAAHPYTRTPAVCPKSKAWTFRAKFLYADGSTRTLTSKSACTRR